MINLKQDRILPQIGRRLFSPPYLPRKFVGLTLLIIITDAFLQLICQKPEYWLDYSQAQISPAFIQQILAIHPLLFLGVILLNVILIGLLLEGLSRTPALILWIVISFIYLDNVLRWTTRRVLMPLPLDLATKNILAASITVIATVLLGWAVVGVLFTSGNTSRRFKPIAIGSIGIWAVLLVFGVVRAMNAPVTGWFLITPEHSPTPRVGGKIVFATFQGKALLFGGSGVWAGGEWQYDNETWEWDGLDWTQQFPEVAPPGRGGMGMAYDPNKNVVVLFGGRAQDAFFDDTWTWDGEAWHNMNPANKPSAREGHEMAYNSQRGQIVLYGGHDELGNFLNDAWGWDGQTWSPISIETSSPQASSFVMVYDQSLDHVVLLLSGNPGNTWLWQGAQWTKLDPNGTAPVNRLSPGAAYDPTNEHMVVFGGMYGEEIVNETWLFDGSQWHENELTLSASARWGHAAFYDETRQKVVIFGGFDGTNYLNDMWEFVPSTQN